MKNKHIRDEDRVAKFWSKRVKVSSFAKMAANVMRPKDCIQNDQLLNIDTVALRVADAVATGRPLTKPEYHLAIACAFLLTEITYKEFFTTRWHETDDHVAYGPKRGCQACKLAAKEKRDAKKRSQAV